MINFITQYSGLFFTLAAYVVCFISLLLTAIVVPSKIAAGIIIAGLIFITYEWSKLILSELEIIKETANVNNFCKEAGIKTVKIGYQYFDENNQETPAYGWKEIERN